MEQAKNRNINLSSNVIPFKKFLHLKHELDKRNALSKAADLILVGDVISGFYGWTHSEEGYKNYLFMKWKELARTGQTLDNVKDYHFFAPVHLATKEGHIDESEILQILEYEPL